jgi:hypothetical protein
VDDADAQRQHPDPDIATEETNLGKTPPGAKTSNRPQARGVLTRTTSRCFLPQTALDK